MCWVAAGVTAGIEGSLVDRKANKYLRDTALEKDTKTPKSLTTKKRDKEKKKAPRSPQNPQLLRTDQVNKKLL